MKHSEWLLFWLAGVIVLGVWAGFSFFSPSAKLRRRRRKSHNRLESTANRPTVRFSVRSPKE
ncbi:MAG TPA: hypothetical protein VL361_24780 [Candidatus Limnocylindrales bacterium]|jgi:hypothetical protein|nr:hypothetical protein [Candidatus Limnocylindrales bacterium]